MNRRGYPGKLLRWAYRLGMKTRRLSRPQVVASFGPGDTHARTIGRIYVINLDRQPLRWQGVHQQLQLLRDRSGVPLSELTTRLSAIDALSYTERPSESHIIPSYCLEDQLRVEPQHALASLKFDVSSHVTMTRQEIAVALSHIGAWRQVANGDCAYALVLEDDACFLRNFASLTDMAWDSLRSPDEGPMFDLLYLSYAEVKGGAEKLWVSQHLFRPSRGLWYLSGYVLSKRGATRLLGLLPVRGPVDLWINHQFQQLDVFAASKPVITQRLDQKSDNRYSILPHLTRLGILNDAKPVLEVSRPVRSPIFAFGEHGTGLTSLAMALSMLGYRCCSDVDRLPPSELSRLIRRKRGRIFDAYVNVGDLYSRYEELAETHPNAVFIVTGRATDRLDTINGDGEIGDWHPLDVMLGRMKAASRDVLFVAQDDPRKWARLSSVLGLVPPATDYPNISDIGQRQLSHALARAETNGRAKPGKADRLPWIVASKAGWVGLPLAEEPSKAACAPIGLGSPDFWSLRNDTFPGNLAFFTPDNAVHAGSELTLTLRKEFVGVRDFTSAAISTNAAYTYGTFEAILRATDVPGLVTGVFLHRNSPRQEIDIELLGRSPSKMLVNVFYNPGVEGSDYEYGYRGTPVLLDLGFDASADFHRYGIEWTPTAIRWFVDGRLVHERANWDPTPIPHLAMCFHVNLWAPNSVELAGRLAKGRLPASVQVRAIYLESPQSTVAAALTEGTRSASCSRPYATTPREGR
jgi:GR25 family glycosyltransferase involved in LPS biosynthesis